MSKKKIAYIKKSDALDCAELEGAYKAMMYISRLPAEDVKPVKHGKWSEQKFFDHGDGTFSLLYICSACKHYIPFKGNYCGRCGAIMDLKEAEKNENVKA